APVGGAAVATAPADPPSPAPVPSGESALRERSAEEEEEADAYRTAVEAAQQANAGSRWELEADAYRRALAVRPTSLDAKEGLGRAIVNSTARSGSYLEAEQLLADVVGGEPGRCNAWLALGVAR